MKFFNFLLSDIFSDHKGIFFCVTLWINIAPHSLRTRFREWEKVGAVQDGTKQQSGEDLLGKENIHHFTSSNT